MSKLLSVEDLLTYLNEAEVQVVQAEARVDLAREWVEEACQERDRLEAEGNDDKALRQAYQEVNETYEAWVEANKKLRRAKLRAMNWRQLLEIRQEEEAEEEE